MKKEKTAIDAVITWVDGREENHKKERKKALKKTDLEAEKEIVTGHDKTRFYDNGEIKYCIYSIRKYAPWIRKIFLVTDNQRPSFLTPELAEDLNVELVDHKIIFRGYESVLPTFNTRTIECGLWRIPGLSPYFIYFNDDFVLSKKVKRKHFFRKDSVVLRGEWNKIAKYGDVKMMLTNWVNILAKNLFGITRSMHLLLQMKSAKLAGLNKQYYRTPHVPHPIRKETLATFFKKYPDLLEKNIKYKFRSTEQFSAIFLAHHLEIKNSNAILRDASDYVMINGELDFTLTLSKKLKLIKDGSIRFLCIQGFEKLKNHHQREIEEMLQEKLGI